MSDAARVPISTWAARRKRVVAQALAAHIGKVEAQKRRPLAEWDHLWQTFQRAPSR